MFKNKLIFAVLALVLIGSIVFIIQKRNKSGIVRTGDKIAIEAANDKSALQMFLDGDNVSEGLVYAAVIRLGQDADKMAFDVAKKLIDHKSKMLREGAAQALGYFPDADVLPLYKKLMSDKEESVRVFAIEGMAEMGSPSRIQTIESKISDPKLSASEKVAIRAALYKMRVIPAEKEIELSELVELAKKNDPILINKASIRAIQLAGDAKVVKELMSESVRSGKDIAVKALSIRILSNLEDEWIKEKLADLVQDSSPQVKVAAIQSIHRTCPVNRWSLIAHVVKKDLDDSVAYRALEEAAYLERNKALELFSQLKADKGLSENRLKMIDAALAEMNKKPEVKICK